jgi:hypothetical protein
MNNNARRLKKTFHSLDAILNEIDLVGCSKTNRHERCRGLFNTCKGPYFLILGFLGSLLDTLHGIPLAWHCEHFSLILSHRICKVIGCQYSSDVCIGESEGLHIPGPVPSSVCRGRRNRERASDSFHLLKDA